MTVLLSINDVFSHVSTFLQHYKGIIFVFTQVYLSKALLNDACSAGHVRQVHSGTGTKAFYKCGDSTDLGGGERGIRSLCTLDSFEINIWSKTVVTR